MISPYATLFSPAQPYSSGRFAPKHAELGHLGNDLSRKAALDVRIADDRENVVIDEGADAVTDGAFLLGEEGIVYHRDRGGS